jgi:tRNA threonylcarbamoyladenosine modification (KEOPS) complex  Pcc1 subunit
MKASLELDVDEPGQVRAAIDPDLQDSDRVSFQTSADTQLHVDIEADSLGVLRGALNTVMRLSKLSTKFRGDS